MIALFLATALILRVLRRRAGVGPGVATAAGATFVLLGSGIENILFGIQVTMMGSLAHAVSPTSGA